MHHFHIVISVILVISQILLVSAYNAPNAQPETDTTLNIDIEHGTEVFFRGGRSYVRPFIAGGGVEQGEFGHERPFLSIPIRAPGRIVDPDVEWGEVVPVRCDVVPYLIPGVIGEKGRIDEEWTGGPIRQERSFSLLHMSGMDVNGRRGNLYSLRLYPFSFHGGSNTLSTCVSFSYTLSDAGPFETQMDEGHKPTGPVKYLIVTDASLVDAVEPLAVWKSQKGLLTRVITINEIKANYEGRDTQEKMRNCVMDFEERFDLEYLLLAGDYTKIPTRNTRNSYPYVGYGEPNTFASDLYFACVSSGSTWNGDGDTLYGEVGEIDDAVPDLAVGRLAIDSSSIMSQVVSTLIRREKELPYNESSKTAIMMAGDPQNVVGDPTDTVDHFWSEYAQDVFEDRETLYYNGEGTMSFGSGSFKEVVGEGHQAISYFSHGTQTGLPNLYNTNQISELSSNGPDGAMFVMACLTGWFDDPTQGSMGYFTDCFGEVITETNGKGLVGYMGASRLAVGGIDRVYSGDAPGLEEDYWRYVHEAVNGNITSNVGTIWKEAVTHFSLYFAPFTSGGSMDPGLRTFLEYNLLGEPDAPLIFKEAENLSLQYFLSPDQGSIRARVTDEGGNNVENASVTIFRYGELGRTMRTNSTGEVEIDIPPSNGGSVNISAYKENYRHDIETFVLDDTLSPVVLHRVTPSDPDGSAGYYVTAPVVTIQGDEPCDIIYRWDDTEAEIAAGQAVLTAPEGNHTLLFRAVDGAGLSSGWNEVSLSVDTTPPGIEIVADPLNPDGNGNVYISTPTVDIRSVEDLSRAEYKINHLSRQELVGPVLILEGFNTVTMWGYDLAGNVNVTQAHFSVDTLPPITGVKVSHLPDGENGYYVTVPFIEPDEQYIGDNTMEYRWDDGKWEDMGQGVLAPEGDSTLFFRGIDPAGNVEVPQFRQFKVDTLAPVMSCTMTPFAPDGDNGFYLIEPLVHVEIDSGDIHYIIMEIGGAVDWSAPHQVMRGDLMIPDGAWTLHIRGVDEAGNVRYLESLDIKVDTCGPDLSYGVSPQEPDGDNGWYRSLVVVRATTLADNSTLFWRNGEGNWTVFKEALYLESGVYDIGIKSVDVAGNEMVRHPGLVKVDRSDPVLEMTGPPGGEVSGPDDVRVTWEGSDNVSGVNLYQVSVDGGPWLDNGMISTFILSSPADGQHSVAVRVFDEAGNFGLGYVRFEVDAVCPYVTYRSPEGQNASIDGPIEVLFSEEMDPLRTRLSVEGVEGNISLSGNSIRFTPAAPLEYGHSYQVAVSGTDLCGNELNLTSWSFSTIELIWPDADDDQELPVAMAAVVLVIFAVLAGAVLLLYLKRRDRITREIWEDEE